jgi:urea carboxylase-associated protein 2
MADPRVVIDDLVPPGGYWSGVIRRGRTLRLVDVEGSGGVALLAYNADDTWERYNAADTVKVQNQVFLTTGMMVLSDMGRVLLSITADSSGRHDTFSGASNRREDEARFGPGTFQTLRNDLHRNAHDNFLMALGRHGLDARDVVPNVNLFDRVEVATDGELEWVGPKRVPGVHVDLRAEVNVLAVLSNTPHPLDPAPAWTTGPLQVSVLDAVPVAFDDPSRVSSDEARRAFDNTDRYVAAVNGSA